MDVRVDVVSIGALSRNALWHETVSVRAPHGTTTLIRDATSTILVDPSLPPDLLVHRLDERAGLKPHQIDAVFLTSFKPAHRRGIKLFGSATWMMSEREHRAMVEGLNLVLGGGGSGSDDVSYEEIHDDLQLLGQIEHAPERLTPCVDLFPCPGVTPGHSGLLVSAARTIVVAGDAVISRDYLVQGRIWDKPADQATAKESLVEIQEIADIIVPGHDNVILIA